MHLILFCLILSLIIPGTGSSARASQNQGSKLVALSSNITKPKPKADIQADKPTSSPKLKGKALYRHIARQQAIKNSVPFALVDAVMKVESNYNPKAKGFDGERGLMQVMPGTAKMLGFNGTLRELADPQTNIRLGTKYLAKAWRLGKQDICTATMKYRAGHGETRFSWLSVKYCKLVRKHLKANGYKVTGKIPKASFGFKNRRALFLGYNGRRRSKRSLRKCLAISLTPGPGYGKCVGSHYYRR